jgi:uncharacterized membrane protein YphA (DoxX/SURF4 family)
MLSHRMYALNRFPDFLNIYYMENLMMNESLPKRNIFIRLISFSWIRKSVLVEIIAHLFIIIFLYTGVAKLMDFDIFQEQLAESPVLEPVAPVITFGLPAVEFIVSILLFLPKYRLKGFYASLFLMIAFTIYVAVLMSFSTQLPCSCGGIMEQLSWKGHLIFNCSCTLLAFAAIRMHNRLNRLRA